MGPTDFRPWRPALVCRSNFHCSVQNVYTACQPIRVSLYNHSKRRIPHAPLWNLICLPVTLGLVTQGGFLWRQRKLLSPWPWVLRSVSPGYWEPPQLSSCTQPAQDFRHGTLSSCSPTCFFLLGSLSHPPQNKLGDCTLGHVWDSHTWGTFLKRVFTQRSYGN